MPYTKSNSKQFEDLNVRPDTIKLLGENISLKLLDISLGNDYFFDLTLKTKATKAKNEQTGLHQTTEHMYNKGNRL